MKVVIIGGVAGGPSLATRLRRITEKAEIVLLERGDHISYASCALPYYLGGVITDRDSLIERTPAILKQKNNIDVRVNHEVTAIDPVRQVLTVTELKTGEQYEEGYDKLVLATGARPVLPPITGINEVDNAFMIRSMTDADHIKFFMDAHHPQNVTVLGAGAAGVELAENFRHAGLAVTLVDQAQQVMQPYDSELTPFIQAELTQHDIRVILGQSVAMVQDQGRTVVLANGQHLPTDMLIVVTGVRPNNELAASAGIQLAANGHVIVDDHLATSVDNIYAIGDVIETTSLITGLPTPSVLSSPANRQGHLLADILTGAPLTYNGFIGVSVVKIFDLTASCVGYTEQTLKAAGITDYETLFVTPFDHAFFYPNAQRLNIKLIFDKATGKIYGGQFVGHSGVDKRAAELSVAITGGLTVHDLPSMEFPYSPPYAASRDALNIVGYVALNKLNQTETVVNDSDLTQEERETGIFLDVREAGKPAYGTLRANLHIPLSELRDRLTDIPKDRPIYILYRPGLAPYNATTILMGNGYRVVVVKSAEQGG